MGAVVAVARQWFRYGRVVIEIWRGDLWESDRDFMKGGRAHFWVHFVRRLVFVTEKRKSQLKF